VAATPVRWPPLVTPPAPLPPEPPQKLPPTRRFPDLERALALDSNHPTFVPMHVREERQVEASGRQISGRGSGPAPLELTPPKVTARSNPRSQTSASRSSSRSRSASLTSGPQDVTEVPASDSTEPVRPARARERRWLYGAGAGALALVGFALVVGAGALQVTSARREVQAHGEALSAVLLGQSELGASLGDRRFDFEDCYDRFRRVAEDEEQHVTASRCVEVALAAGQTGVVPEAVRPRILELQRHREDYQRAVDTWRTLATRFPGSWSAAMGLVRAP
jgi:hypothetical protein